MKGSVYIIGAGCGSRDLITLRGLDALKKCDTVVYDALIDPGTLSFADANAELICVGKRAGKHSAAQDEINAILVEKALAGRTVARLKGGDPFVFGRGGEEAEELQKNGIPYTVIPGVSSAVAVPELAGIPVTHRAVSRSFHVITAHTAEGHPSFGQYANCGGTLVFLMGMSSLGDIADSLMRGGMSGDTPAAVISHGCTPAQKTVRAPLSAVADAAARENCTAPAVIVVGETAKLSFSGVQPSGALSGVSVTVTGTRRFTDKLSAMLEQEGAFVRSYSHIRIVQTHEIPPLDGFTTIAFTSSYGAELFMRHCRATRTDLRRLAGIRFAAVGSGTAETLEAYGIIPDIMPETFTVDSLAEAIADNASAGEHVLALRARLGSGSFGEVLAKRGIACTDVRIYDTEPVRGLPAGCTDTDYIVFGSSSGVSGFFDCGNTLSPKTVPVCIGRQTAETAKKYTARTDIITSSPHTAQGAADAVIANVRNGCCQNG